MDRILMVGVAGRRWMAAPGPRKALGPDIEDLRSWNLEFRQARSARRSSLCHQPVPTVISICA